MKDHVSIDTDELCLTIRAITSNITVAYHSDWRPPPGRVLKPLSAAERKRLKAYRANRKKP